MRNKELENYSRNILNLTEEEQMLRNNYLRKLAMNEIQGPMVGYPSIDKLNLRYYRQDPIREINPNQTIYELVFKTNKDNLNDIALGYINVEWSYEKLKKETDAMASALRKISIEKNDVVLVGLSNTPESVVILLALNKLGAVSKWFDVRAGEKDIEEYANDSNCKAVIALDSLLPKINLICDNTNLEKIISVNPMESLMPSNNIANDETVMSDRYLDYHTLRSMADENEVIECVEFDKNRPSIMIQSSGTTGKPKTIVHSDFSATSCTHKISYSDLPLGRGKSLLVALPPWIAYGLGDAIILPLAFGMKVELSPIFSAEAVFKNVGKFNIAFAAPFNYRYLRDNFDKLSDIQKEQFKKVECLVSGGDKISPEENKEFEEIFNTKLVNGYGDNEGWGALTVNPCNHNKYGTVGIPKYGEIVMCCDLETNEELEYGEVGEICSLTDTKFIRYENNEEKTNAVRVKHSDGLIWLHTGDIGIVDSEGFVTVVGRKERVIVRLAFKIAASTIEDKICEHSAVKECVAVAVKDVKEEHCPMAFITLKNEYKDNANYILEDIKKKCISELKEYELPKYFEVVESLPYTQNGKYNFRELEEVGNDCVDKMESAKHVRKLTQ